MHSSTVHTSYGGSVYLYIKKTSHEQLTQKVFCMRPKTSELFHFIILRITLQIVTVVFRIFPQITYHNRGSSHSALRELITHKWEVP